jgi:hypothetical protein
MLIIWRGLGFLVPLIGIGALLATQSVIGNAYYDSHGWPKFVAGLVAGLLVFFIPVEAWGVIIFVYGIVASLSE